MRKLRNHTKLLADGKTRVCAKEYHNTYMYYYVKIAEMRENSYSNYMYTISYEADIHTNNELGGEYISY